VNGTRRIKREKKKKKSVTKGPKKKSPYSLDLWDNLLFSPFYPSLRPSLLLSSAANTTTTINTTLLLSSPF